MARLVYRRGNVFTRTGTTAGFGSGYTITVYPPGAQVETAGNPATVRAGHGFTTVGQKFIVGTTTTTVYETSVIADTAITSTVATNAVPGDLLVNIGADGGSATSPSFNASPMLIYSDMAGGTAISQSTVTANADGEYEYWYAGGEVWEVCRNGSIVSQIEIVGQTVTTGVRYANAWATGGSGTSADPWTGFRNVLASNCVIKFPAGYYDVGATALDVSSSYSNIVLEGEGDATVFVSDDGVSAIGHVTNGVEASNCIIRNLKIDGESNTKTANGLGIRVGDATDIIIDDITFQDIPGSAINISAGTSCTGLVIKSCRIVKLNATNCSCENLTTDNPALSAGYGFGIVLTNAPDAIIEGCTINITEFSGIYISTGCEGTRVSNCRLDQCENGIRFYCGNVTLAYNYITNSGSVIGGGGGDAIRVGDAGAATYGAVIIGNRLEDNVTSSGCGVRSEGDNYGMLINGNYMLNCNRGVHIWNNNGSTTKKAVDCIVSNNVIDTMLGSGITLRPTCENVSVCNNVVVNCDLYGIATSDVGGSSSTLYVFGNTYQNNTSGNEYLGADVTGSHDGLADAAVLTDTTKSWTTDEFIGFTLRNLTDGSSTVITANTATTATGVLAGGTQNDWDIGDDYSIDSCWTYAGGPKFVTAEHKIVANSSTPALELSRAAGAAVFQMSRSNLPATWRMYVDGSGHLTFDDYQNTKNYALCLKDVNGYVGICESNPVYILTVGGLSNTQRLGIHAQTTTLTCSSGTIVHSAQNFIPAGVLLVGVTARVTTAITGSPGPATIKIGTYSNDVSPVAIDITAFGTGISPLVDTTTDLSNTTQTSATFYATGCRVSITSGDGATFGGGVVRITCHYIILAAPAS